MQRPASLAIGDAVQVHQAVDGDVFLLAATVEDWRADGGDSIVSRRMLSSRKMPLSLSPSK